MCRFRLLVSLILSHFRESSFGSNIQTFEERCNIPNHEENINELTGVIPILKKKAEELVIPYRFMNQTAGFSSGDNGFIVLNVPKSESIDWNKPLVSYSY